MNRFKFVALHVCTISLLISINAGASSPLSFLIGNEAHQRFMLLKAQGHPESIEQETSPSALTALALKELAANESAIDAGKEFKFTVGLVSVEGARERCAKISRLWLAEGWIIPSVMGRHHPQVVRIVAKPLNWPVGRLEEWANMAALTEEYVCSER